MKVAIVYDRLNKWGGAERVLVALREIFPSAHLFTSVHFQEKTPSNYGVDWQQEFTKVTTSFLQRIAPARRNHEFFAPLMPLAFESLDLSSYDLVISVTSEFAKGVITGPYTLHICYCLTPTRYLWSGHDDYFSNKLLRVISQPVVYYLRKWDVAAAQRPDLIVSISNEVKKRVGKFYGRESKVIYPPTHLNTGKAKAKKSGKYYLLVSRLVSYKKVDLAIEAFNKMGKELVIVGEGRCERDLKLKAKKNVVFLRRLTDRKLSYYYMNTRALIMPQDEDFGLAAVEVQMHGKPVIAFKAGGALDTVIEGATGVFFDKQTPASIIDAIERFEKMNFSKKIIKQNAKRFSKEKFKREFAQFVKDAAR